MKKTFSEFLKESSNREIFIQKYTEKLFDIVVTKNDPDYSYVRSQRGDNISAYKELATKMTDGLIKGSASKDGDAIKATCKELKIPQTYKAIQAFLNS